VDYPGLGFTFSPYFFVHYRKKGMRVGIIGFGRAGRAVANVILANKDFRLEWVVRRSSLLENRSVSEFLGVETDEPGLIYSLEHTSFAELFKSNPVDFVIDFSAEDAILKYGEDAAQQGIKIITAVSHYGADTILFLKELSKKTVVFWSPNITLGVNYLIFAAKFLKKIAPWADVKISEEHFREKQGLSGTAKIIAQNLDISENEINTSRIGGVVGRHEVTFGFPYQTVRLVHESISREAFGNGAMFAAINLTNKKVGFYNFEDILLPYFAM